MLKISSSLQARFEAYLRNNQVPNRAYTSYKKWLRFYLDFCRKYHFSPTQRESLPHFLDKLREKKQTKTQQQQASHAISLYYELLQHAEPLVDAHPPPKVSPAGKTAKVSPRPVCYSSSYASTSNRASSPLKNYPSSAPPFVFTATNEPPPQTGASWEAEYTGLVNKIRLRHYSPKTLKTYRQWVRRFQTFTKSNPPESLSPTDVKKYLTWLAVGKNVSE